MDNIQAYNDSWINEIERLVLNVSFLTDLGLFHGKMGHAIFFAHYGRLVDNVSYENFAGELLEEVYEEINISLPVNMEYGLCGIGWGIEYLVGQGFMEGCTDEILKDIDELIMERDPRRMHDLSFRKGLGGILYYVMVRLSSLRETDNLPFDSFYLESLREVVLEKDFSKEKSLSFLIDDFILVLEGKKRVKPDLSVLFQVSPPRKSSTDLLSDGLEYGWQMLESGDAGKLYKNYHWHKGKNYYLINEESESANYGIGTYLNQITETMKESDYSLTIITLRSSKTSSLAIEEKANVRYISIGGTRCKMSSMNWIKYFKRYYRGVVVLLSSIITEKQNNIFHLNNMHMKDLALVLKENNPASKIVCTVHYMDWALQLLGDRRKLDYILSHPDEKDYKTISVVLEENKRFMKACDLIIAVSRHSFNVLVDICGIPESKIVLIPHGIKDEYLKSCYDLRIREFMITGGDIFVYKHWRELLNCMREYNMNIGLLSTKTPLQEEDVRLVKDYHVNMQFSLDAVDSSILKEVVGMNSDYLPRVRETFEFFDKYKLRYKVTTVLTKINASVSNVLDLYEFLQQFQCLAHWEVRIAHKSLYSKWNFEKLKIAKESIQQIDEAVQKIKGHSKFKISWEPVDRKHYFQAKQGSKSFKGSRCSANYSNMMILPDGKVTICEQLYWNPNYIIGDLTKQSIPEVWNSPRALALAFPKRDDFRDVSPCKRCKIFEECYNFPNRCIVDVLKGYGEVNSDFPDPRCVEAPAFLSELRPE